MVAPLGIGGHVDHQIAHAAARKVRGAERVFYEDTPYVLTRHQLPRRLHALGFRIARPDSRAHRGDTTIERASGLAEARDAQPFLVGNRAFCPKGCSKSWRHSV